MLRNKLENVGGRLYRQLIGAKQDKEKPTVITFTGGMGAQLLSAAIYFSMKKDGNLVYADLSYFDEPESVAAAGNEGQCSHWAWQLSLFGLTPAMFDINPGLNKRNSLVLADGPAKLEAGLKALAQPAIQAVFDLPPEAKNKLPAWVDEKFLCIHIRRGDYVNVASYLLADEAFIALAKKFSGLIGRLVVLSDSPIESSFREAMTPFFEKTEFIDHSEASEAHQIMRKASILICSNSQFSLIAAVLNPNALVMIPKQWFGDGDRAIEAPLHERCVFQIMGS